MNAYADTVRKFLAENEPNYGDGGVSTLLEMLYQTYTEYNPIDSAAIREAFVGLEDCLCKLSLDEIISYSAQYVSCALKLRERLSGRDFVQACGSRLRFRPWNNRIPGIQSDSRER